MLEHLLTALPNASALRVQSRSVVVVAECDCGCSTIDLEVIGDDEVPLHPDPSAADEGERLVSDGIAGLEDVLLWTDGGRLSLLEHVVADASAAPFLPRPEDIEVL